MPQVADATSRASPSSISSEAKARGAFYTPRSIASFIATWAVRAGANRVLEPSAGDGAMVRAVVARFRDFSDEPGVRVVAVESDPSEAAKCRSLGTSIRVLERDFFGVLPEDV